MVEGTSCTTVESRNSTVVQLSLFIVNIAVAGEGSHVAAMKRFIPFFSICLFNSLFYSSTVIISPLQNSAHLLHVFLISCGPNLHALTWKRSWHSSYWKPENHTCRGRLASPDVFTLLVLYAFVCLISWILYIILYISPFQGSVSILWRHLTSSFATVRLPFAVRFSPYYFQPLHHPV